MTELTKYDSTHGASQVTYLQNYISFYRSLSEKGKKRFLYRVRKFIRIKDFEFFFEPGPEKVLIKTLIAASCIQITWGIHDKYISSYNYIGVYADALKLQKGKGVIRNAIWLTKNINFPWSKIKEGFILPDNAKHVGLFKWTRALIILAKKDNIMDDFFSAYYKVWCEAARDIMFVVDEDVNLPLDKFGQKLPVIVQHFFEEPEELKLNHPLIYEHTKRLLNLDLLDAKEYDYVYSKKMAAQKKTFATNRALLFGVQNEIRKFGLPSGIMYYILVQFPVIIAIWFMMGRWTYFSWKFNMIFAALSLLGSFIIYQRYYVKRGLSKTASAILFSIGLVPFIYSSMCLLNYSIPITYKSKTVIVSRPEMLELYLPWKGFAEPHIKNIEIIDSNPADSTNIIKGVVNGMITTYTQKVAMKNVLFLLDGNDKVEMHTYVGLLGAEVFDGYVITINK